MQKYVFNEYDKIYKKYFEEEKKKLQKLLAKARIEHVGSTAVPGLGGKGIVDILVGVNELTTELPGYEYRENASTAERLFFRKDYNGRRVHVHLVRLNCRDWKEMIAFRDYLIQHQQAVKEYEKIKKEAVEKAKGDRVTYRKYKREFIERITQQALKDSTSY